MEEYLSEFGISPREFGLDGFFNANTQKKGEKIISKNNEGINNNRFSKIMLKNLPLTMAYVPFQQIDDVYTQEEALKSGTLFPNLDKPFLCRKP